MGKMELAILPVDDAKVAVLRAGVQNSKVSEALHMRRAERESSRGQEMLASRKRNGETVARGSGTALKGGMVRAQKAVTQQQKARTSSSMMHNEFLVACCNMLASSRHSVVKVDEFAQSSALPSRENKRSSSRKDANSSITRRSLSMAARRAAQRSAAQRTRGNKAASMCKHSIDSNLQCAVRQEIFRSSSRLTWKAHLLQIGGFARHIRACDDNCQHSLVPPAAISDRTTTARTKARSIA